MRALLRDLARDLVVARRSRGCVAYFVLLSL
jgi:hypothetical protein